MQTNRLRVPVVVTSMLAAVLVFATTATAAYSPKPGDLVYMRARDFTLLAARADGTSPVSLGLSGSTPKWSPDGSRLAFYSRTDPRLMIWDFASASLVDLAEQERGFSDGVFSWNTAGTGVLHWVDTGSDAEIPERWNSITLNALANPAIEVFGARAAYIEYVSTIGDDAYVISERPYALIDDENGYWRDDQPLQLRVVDINGTILQTAPIGQLRLVNLSNPCASPDGKRVVFSGSDAGTYSSIFLWDLETNRVSVLFAGGHDYNFYPRFTADGQWVVWGRRESGAQWGPDVWAIRANGKTAYPLLRGAYGADPRPVGPMPSPTPTRLSRPTVSRSPRSTRATALSGIVSPRHSTPVIVSIQRLGSRGYKSYRHQTAYANSNGQWTLRLKLPKGRIRIRADSAPAVIGHAKAPAGAWRSFRVR